MSLSILITHDEQCLGASLHLTAESALETLRQYLNDTPVNYQEALPEDATAEQIKDAAIDRSQFAWEIHEAEAPAQAAWPENDDERIRLVEWMGDVAEGGTALGFRAWLDNQDAEDEE